MPSLGRHLAPSRSPHKLQLFGFAERHQVLEPPYRGPLLCPGSWQGIYTHARFCQPEPDAPDNAVESWSKNTLAHS